MKQRVLISGALGHMGQAVLSAMQAAGGELVPAVGVDIAQGDFPGALFASAEAVNVPFDMVIDFSRPAAAMAALDLCLRERKPFVTGTTGLGDEEMAKLLATDGMLVKRPLLVDDGFVLVGFREQEWAERL